MILIAGLGKAFIEVHADTRPFAKQLIPEIEAILAAAEKALQSSTRKLGEKIGSGIAQGVKDQGSLINKTIRKTVEEGTNKVRPKVPLDIDVDDVAKKAVGLFSKIGSGLLGIGKRFGESFGTLFEGLKTSVANIFNIPTKSPLAPVLTVLVTSILPAIISLIIPLAAAVADLVGFVALIPGAFAAVLAILPPLIIGFKGLGDAITLAFEKDPKKFREGLKELGPAVRELVLLLRPFVPLFEQLGKKIQDAFIRPITQALGPALRNSFGVFEKGFVQLAGGLGRFFGSIVTFIGSKRTTDFLQKLFPTLVRIIDRMGPAVIRILDALTQAAEKSLPFLERIAENFGDFLERFAGFIETAIKDGRFNKFLEDAFKSLSDIKDLVGAVTGLFTTLFTQTDEDGRNLIKIFTDLFKQFDDFFKSEEGKDLMRELSILAIVFADNLKLVLPVLGTLLLPFIAISLVVNNIIFGIRLLIELIKDALGFASDLDRLLGRGPGMIRRRGAPSPGAGLGPRVPLQEGGFITSPTKADLGEGFNPEVVVPLTKPRRASELLSQAGLIPNTNVTVFLGTHQITDILDVRVERAFELQRRQLVHGPRSS